MLSYLAALLGLVSNEYNYNTVVVIGLSINYLKNSQLCRSHFIYLLTDFSKSVILDLTRKLEQTSPIYQYKKPHLSGKGRKRTSA